MFGRSRESEDVVLLVEHLGKETFEELWKDLDSAGFECLNAHSIDAALELLNEKTAIRFCYKNQFIPNMEFKWPETNVDTFTLNNKVKVILNKHTRYCSPIEMQIVYKLYLGSEKDIEDAKHLYEVFKEYLNEEALFELLDDFGPDVKKRFNLIK